MKRILSFCIFFGSIVSINAAVYKVTTTNFTGPGSISEAVGFANSNVGQDTIVFDVKGTINITSPITISNYDLIIQGPGSGNVLLAGSSSSIFEVTVGGATVYINSLSFSNPNGKAITFNTGHLEISDCIFKDCVSPSNGGAIQMNNPAFLLRVDRCSFVENVATIQNGGSIYSNSGDVFISNSTFGNTNLFLNTNAQHGGAIYINNGMSNCEIVNNTFAQLIVLNDGGAIWINNNNPTILNNLFFQNNGAAPSLDLYSNINLVTNNSLRNYNNFGGATTNNYSPSTEDYWGNSGTNYWRTWVQSAGNSNHWITKTGREHYILNITDPDAPFIDNGGSVPFSLDKDVRNAPRELKGTFYGMQLIDRGSMEFSPFRVSNNNATGLGSLADIIDSVNNTLRPIPYYVWFDIPNAIPHTILSTSQYLIYKTNCYIDGFSQRGSKEGTKSFGPEYMIDLVDNATLTTCFYTFGDDTEIRGFKIQDFEIAVLLFSNSVKVFGNYIINSEYGITSGASTSFCEVGSHKGKDRNYIVSCNAKALEISGSFHNVRGNYIGVQPNGVANGNFEGLDLTDAINCSIGGYAASDGNLISANTSYGIRLLNSDNNYIQNNLLGMNTALTAITGFENGVGIQIEDSEYNEIGSSVYPFGGNVIASATANGMVLHNARGNIINGNIIGLLADGVTAGMITQNGIHISGTTNQNSIGDYMTYDYRNTISNCGHNGILSDATSGNSNYINHNLIGTDINGLNNMGNGRDGIRCIGYLVDDFISPQAYIEYNVIANHTSPTFGNGIYIEDGPADINNNKIGKYTNGTSAPNRNGIYLKGYSQGGYVNQNVIENSTNIGIVLDAIENDVYFTFIENNSIKNATNQGILVTNGSIRIKFREDTVINNGNGGIIVHAGCDSIVMRSCILNSNGAGLDFDLGNNGAGGYTMNESLPFATLSTANLCGSDLSVFGTFSDANFSDVEFECEYYLIPSGSAHASNHGGSHVYLGMDYMTTDITGYGELIFNQSGSFNAGDKITVVLSRIDSESVVYSSEFSANIDITSTFSVTVNETNAFCNGGTGSAIANVTGTLADPSWHYTSNIGNPFSNGISVSLLPPDSYACILVDGSCSDTAYFTITEPTTLLMGSILLTNISCNGLSDGVIEFQGAIGGTSPYSYSIDGGSNLTTTTLYNNLLPGNYPLKVQDVNGCELDSIVPITEPLAIIANEFITHLTCFESADGSIVTNPSGGMPGYSFSWTGPALFTSTNQNIFGLVAGSYDLEVTDAIGCISNHTYVVNQPAQLNIGFTISNPTPCTGEGVTFMNTSDPGATSFLWDFGNGDLANITLENSSTTYPSDGAFNVKYIVTYGSCVDSLTQIINVNPTPYLSSPNNTQICSGDNVNFTFTSTQPASSFSWNAIDNTNVTGETFAVQNTALNNDQLINVSGSPQMVEYLVYTSTAQCANTGQSFYAWVFPLPNVIAPNDTTICANQPLTLSGTGAVTYSWDNGITNGVSFNPTVTTTYTVTGVDGDGCENTDNVTVIVNSLPSVTASSNSPVCESSTLILTGAPNGASLYSWSGPATFASTNQNPSITGVTLANAGTYTLTVIDINGCQGIGNTTVVVNTLPIVTATSNSPVCQGQDINLSGLPNAASSYQWSGPATFSSFTQNPIISGTTVINAGTYTLTITDANGCQGVGNTTVVVNTLPNVTAPNDYAICSGAPTTLTGTGAVSYTWDNGVTDGVTFNPASTSTYTVTGTDANGCQNTDEVIITINNLPNVVAPADYAICNGQSTSLTGSGASTYTWTNGVSDGISFSPFTTNTYTVTGIDANGCENTDDVIVTVNNLPTILAPNYYSICQGQSTTLSASGGVSYTWDNGVTDGVPFAPTIMATYTVVGVDANGCTDNDTVTISINSLPNVTAPNDYSICSGAPTTLNGSGASTYTWDNGVTDGVAFNPTSTATYTVTGTDANGCQNTDAVIVTVNSTMVLTLNVTDVSCNGLSDGIVQYVASGGVTPYSIEINGAAPLLMSSNTGTLSGLNGGFVFNGVLIDGLGCTTSNQTTVSEPSAISFTASTISDTCNAGVGSLNYSSINGGVSPYLYANLSGTFTSSTSALGTAGSYVATVQDANGCQSSQNVTISSVTVPVNGGVNGPYSTCADEPIEIVAFGGTSYSWSGGSGSIPSVANPTVNPSQNTMYYVTINFGTCSMIDSVLVSIDSSCDSLDNNTVINTNAFSPNGDGINDVVTFDIPNLLLNNENKVYFINRWSDVVRTYSNYNNADVAWDGKNMNGVDLPEGTYFYIIEIPSQDYKSTGWIQLIR